MFRLTRLISAATVQSLNLKALSSGLVMMVGFEVGDSQKPRKQTL